VADALRAKRLLPEPPPREPKRRARGKPRGRIDKTYDYVDERGALVLQTVRYEPKDFSQRRPDGNGGWINDLDGIARRPLYRLPELLAADPAQTVWLCEGERDADRLRSLGLVATTNPQGAESWGKVDSGPLSGRHVVLLPDNDAGGERHRADVATDLAGKAASLRVLKLPGLPPKGDVSDWLDAGGTVEKLLELAGAAPVERKPLVLDRKDPLVSARRFIADRHAGASGPLLLRHRGDFHRFQGTHWPTVEDGALRADAYAFLESASCEDRGELAPFKPTAAKVNDFLDALKAAVHLDGLVAAPRWLSAGASRPLAAELVPMQNGLFHLPSGTLLPSTPEFFNHHALPFAHDPAAPEPKEWLAFLASIWPDDGEARDALQETMGYLISGDRRQQKVFLLVGPPRSGKGTIGEVIRALVGPESVAGPTLADLGNKFGLAPLIGKPVAIISDARLSGRADAAVIAERLLSISGEDAITIDRKHREHWTGQLPTRFLVLTNELPRIADASGALASRFVAMTMTRSFYGREDHGLKDRLLQELPAIFNWAVEGWRRLARRGRFVMPESSLAAIEEIQELSSPILAFLKECCTVEPGAEVECSELYKRWRHWCDEQGRREPGPINVFSRDLRAAVAGLDVYQPRLATGGRSRFYRGVRIGTLARTGTRSSYCTRGQETDEGGEGREDLHLRTQCVERVPVRATGNGSAQPLHTANCRSCKLPRPLTPDRLCLGCAAAAPTERPSPRPSDPRLEAESHWQEAWES
jgi:putative DNA primase/helicase